MTGANNRKILEKEYNPRRNAMSKTLETCAFKNISQERDRNPLRNLGTYHSGLEFCTRFSSQNLQVTKMKRRSSADSRKCH